MATRKKPTDKSIELSREAPVERQQSLKDFLGSVFNEAQIRVLINKTPEYAIKKRAGPKGKSLSYVKHGYVTDQLNKLFGFNWDLINEPMSNGSMYALEIERYPNPDARAAKIVPIIEVRHVAVAGHIEARVKTKDGYHTIIKSGFGSQIWHPSMELGDALKAAQSDLLKSCASKIGVALDLYWDDMAEQEQYEKERIEKQEREKVKDDFIDSFAEEVSYKNNGTTPANGVMLIAMAGSMFKLDVNQIKAILGDNFINEFNSDMWQKIVDFAERKT